jgi:hypothetical protein
VAQNPFANSCCASQALTLPPGPPLAQPAPPRPDDASSADAAIEYSHTRRRARVVRHVGSGLTACAVARPDTASGGRRHGRAAVQPQTSRSPLAAQPRSMRRRSRRGPGHRLFPSPEGAAAESPPARPPPPRSTRRRSRRCARSGRAAGLRRWPASQGWPGRALPLRSKLR